MTILKKSPRPPPRAAPGRFAPVGGHAEMVSRRLAADPEARRAYEDMKDELALFAAFRDARQRLGLSQAEAARRMGTSRPVIARLESPGTSTLPNLDTVKRYARILGFRLTFSLAPA